MYVKGEAISNRLRGKEKMKRKSHFSVNKEIKKIITIALFDGGKIKTL